MSTKDPFERNSAKPTPIAEASKPTPVVEASKPTPIAELRNVEVPKASVSPKPAISAPSAETDVNQIGELVDGPKSQEAEYNDEELLPLLDSLLHNGYTLDEFSLRDTKIVLRSRFTWEEREVFSKMDKLNPNTALQYQRMFSIYMIATALVRYGEHVFAPKNNGSIEDLIKDLNERFEFVSSLPTPIVDILEKRLMGFDAKHRYIVMNIEKLTRDF